MRKFAWLVLILICLFATLTYALKGFRGGQITPSKWLFETGDCQQPCWHGIQPGTTTLAGAVDVLKSLTFVSNITPRYRVTDICDLSWSIDLPIPYWGCANTNNVEDTRIARMWISVDRTYRHQGVEIKDMFLVLGVPERAGVCIGGANVVVGKLEYGTDVEVTIVRWDYDGLPSPFYRRLPLRTDMGRVEGIFYQQPGSEPLYQVEVPLWEGFTPIRRNYSDPAPMPRNYNVQC